MSWFKRKPHAREPQKTQPYRLSPMTDKILKEIKEEVNLQLKEDKNLKNNKN